MARTANRSAVVIGLALAVLILNAVASYHNAHHLAQSHALVEHTHEVRAEVEHVLSLLKDAETGQRGYLLTAEDRYLDPYRTAVTEVTTAIQRLQDLTADNPRQQRRLAEFRRGVAVKLYELRQTLDDNQARSPGVARHVVLSDRGRQAMDDLRRLTAEMIAEENDLLAQRAADARAAYRTMLVTFLLATGAGAALAGLGYSLVRRLLTEHARANVKLEGRVRERMAELEARGRELARERERFRVTLASIGDAVIATDTAGRMTLLNPVAEALTGWAEADARGRPLADAFRVGDARTGRPADDLAAQALRLGPVMGLAGEAVLTARDGTERPVDASAAPIRGDGGAVLGTVLVFRDVGGQRRLEEQLRHAQKMEVVGRLAGGIAHDFNNLLTVINGFAEVARAELPAGSAREAVETIQGAGERAAALTGQLLAFSRKQVLAPQALDLREVVGGMERLLRRVVGEDVDLAAAFGPEPCCVTADPGQVEQVIMNLAVNARDAMPTGGRLTVEARCVDLDEAYTRAHAGVNPGRYALLAVSDSGCGMAEDVKARIFEPFFTTKGVGKGTGLGLATVYGIVRQSGGHVDVYSEVGFGTTFKVYLPRARESSEILPPSPDPSGAPRGDETVLLAEDEPGVRALARRTLLSHGYRVLEAGNGPEALEVAAGYPGEIHLLLTDVVMPGLSGRQVAERLRRRGTRVLYLSGYADDAVVRHGVIEGGANFLQKPFTPHTLARKVREVLDAPADTAEMAGAVAGAANGKVDYPAA
jgi:PAS domain S-box-containing protein